jgi:hypothetical protein
MPRKPIGDHAMTPAERQARRRAKLSSPPTPRPPPRAADPRSRARRWNDAVAELIVLQSSYATWLETIPDNLQESATALALREICDLDLSEIQAIVPPRGFGRD